MRVSTDIFPVEPDKQLQAVPEGTYKVYVKANIFSEEIVFANIPCEISVWSLLGKPSNPDDFYVEIDGEGVSSELLPYVAANPGQLVDIKRVPGDDDILRILLNIALIVVSIWVPGLTSLGKFGQAVLGAVILTAGQIAINALIPFEQPDLTSTTPAALNNIGATRNRLEPFAIIPRIFGKVRQYPPYAANPFTEILGNDVWLNALFCIGEGSKFDVSDVRIGTTEITDMSDVALIKTTTPEYPDIFQENLNIELKQDALDPGGDEAIRSTQQNTTRASIDVSFPRGLALLLSDGAKRPWIVDYSVEFRLKGSTDVWNSVTFTDWKEQTNENKDTSADPLHTFEDENGNVIFDWRRGGFNLQQPVTQPVFQSPDDQAHFRIRRTTVDAFRLSIKWTFPNSGEWDVRVKRRGSVNPENGVRIDTNNVFYTDNRIADIFLFTTLRSFNDNNVTAVDNGGDIWYMQLRIKATDQLSGALDTFNYLVEGYTRPYDGNTWLAPTKNRSPAWAFAEVLTGKSSAEPVPDVDLIADELKLWDDWATDNNFTFDFEFVAELSMFDVLNRIASAGRAALSQREGKFTVITDNEQTAPVQMFTRRNSRNFRGTKVFLDTLHGVKVRWRSENEDYQWTEREVYNTGFDETNATRFEVLELLGIVQDDQAFKMALRYMAEAIHRPEFYFLDTDFEHLIAQRGDTVLVQNERMLVGTASARIQSINGLVVTLDQGGFIVENAKSYVLRFRTQVGQESNPQSIDITVANVTAPGSGTDVSVFTVDAVPPSANKGDMVVFGELTSDTIRCKVVEVFPKDNLEASLSLTIESAAIYDADSGTIPPYVPVIGTIPDPSNVVPPVPFIVAIESSGFIGTQQAGGILILKAVISYNIDLVDPGYGGPLWVQIAYREFDQDNDAEAGGIKYSEWVPHDQANIVITNLADNQVYQFFIRSRSTHGTVSLFSLGKEHLVSGAPDVAIQSVDLFTVSTTVLGVILSLDVTNVIQKNLQHLEIKYSTFNNRDGNGSPDPIPDTFIAPLPSNLDQFTTFDIFVPLPNNIERFFWARLTNIYSQSSAYFPLSATAGLPGAAIQFPSPTHVISLIYDDLDTTGLAAGKSRYAMLTDVATNSSGSQNNFQNTDAILINKKDKDGVSHGLFLAEIREGNRIVFKPTLNRWFVFKVTDTKFEIVGTGDAEAYKIDVALLEFSDSDPSANISTAPGTDVTFEIHKSLFDISTKPIIDPDFDLSVALTGPITPIDDLDSQSFPGNANFWAWDSKTNDTPETATPTRNADVILIIGGGVNGQSNAIKIETGLITGGTAPYRDRVHLWHVHRFRTNTPAFDIKIRYRNQGTIDFDLPIFRMVGYDQPRGGTVLEFVTQQPTALAPTGATWTDLIFHVEGTGNSGAQYWEFQFRYDHTIGGSGFLAPTQELEFDSIFVTPTGDTFGKNRVGSDIQAGIVPSSGSGDVNKVLQADGAWVANTGGAAPVDSVFGRTGAVVAILADYDGFFLTPAEGDAVYPRLADTETITGAWKFTASAGLLVESTAPIYEWNETDAAVDEGRWRIRANAGQWEFSTGNDAATVFASIFSVQRTGNSPDTVAFQTPITATSYNGVLGGNLLDKSAIEIITGAWNFQNTANVYNGINQTNLLDKTAAETISGVYTFSARPIMNAGLNLNNAAIVGVGNIDINDPGTNEGLNLLGGNIWRIFESPNVFSNAAGNMQFVQGSTRRMTINTSGQVDIPVATGIAPLLVASTTLVSNLNADLLDGQSGAFYQNAVDSVFGRTGAVVALQADYDGFFLTPAEGDAVYPRFADPETISGAWKFTNAAGILVESTAPIYEWEETDAAVDEKRWRMQPIAGQFVFSTGNDAGTIFATIFSVPRTGNSADSVAFNKPITAVSYNGILNSDLLDKSAIEVITGAWNFQSTSNVYNGINQTNLLDKTAIETISGLWTHSGRLVTDDSTTVRAGFNIPIGVAPTAPVQGDVWATLSSVFARLNSVSVDLAAGEANVVDSVFGRTGAVAALQADYDGFFLTPAEGDSVYPRFADAETISGAWKFTNAAGLLVENTQPRYDLIETDAAVDEGRWRLMATVNQFLLATVNDANTVVAPFMTVQRTGNNPDSVAFDVPITATSYNGVLNFNLLDKSAIEVITGAWNFQSTSNVYNGINQTNLLDKTAAELLTGNWNWQDRLVERPEFKDYAITHQVVTVAASTTVNYTLGQNVLLDLQPASITTLTLSNPPASGNYGELKLEIVQGSVARTITWPASVKWSGGVAPTLSTVNDSIDVVHLWTRDGGTKWHGSFVLDSK